MLYEFFCEMQFCRAVFLVDRVKRFFILQFFLCLASFWVDVCCIHFGATEKDLGHLGLYDCSPFPHKHTNADQLDSGIAVHSTDKHQRARVSDDSGLLVKSSIIVHMAHEMQW